MRIDRESPCLENKDIIHGCIQITKNTHQRTCTMIASDIFTTFSCDTCGYQNKGNCISSKLNEILTNKPLAKNKHAIFRR